MNNAASEAPLVYPGAPGANDRTQAPFQWLREYIFAIRDAAASLKPYFIVPVARAGVGAHILRNESKARFARPPAGDLWQPRGERNYFEKIWERV